MRKLGFLSAEDFEQEEDRTQERPEDEETAGEAVVNKTQPDPEEMWGREAGGEGAPGGEGVPGQKMATRMKKTGRLG